MTRALVLLAMLCLLGQSMSYAGLSVVMAPQEVHGHEELHFHGVAHHHAVDGALQLDDSVESVEHMLEDRASFPALHPAGFFPTAAHTCRSPLVASAPLGRPSAEIDLPDRPPRSVLDL